MCPRSVVQSLYNVLLYEHGQGFSDTKYVLCVRNNMQDTLIQFLQQSEHYMDVTGQGMFQSLHKCSKHFSNILQNYHILIY